MRDLVGGWEERSTDALVLAIGECVILAIITDKYAMSLNPEKVGAQALPSILRKFSGLRGEEGFGFLSLQVADQGCGVRRITKQKIDSLHIRQHSCAVSVGAPISLLWFHFLLQS